MSLPMHPARSIYMTRELLNDLREDYTVAQLSIGPLPMPLSWQHRQQVNEFVEAAHRLADAHEQIVNDATHELTVVAYVRNLPREGK